MLVTGGAGYVGSHCVRHLCEQGFEVAVFDRIEPLGHREAVDSRAVLIEGCLSDHHLVEQTVLGGGFDAVMHFAALAEVGQSVKEPLLYYDNNLAQTVFLLDCMRRADVKRFIFSSTCAVYGVPPSVPIVEDMPKQPISPYGRSKLAVEWTLADCANAWGLGATALRYFNAAGASADGSIGEDHTPESHLIPIVLQVALGQRERVSIFGTDYPTPDGTCVRDYIHVEDLASAHRLALAKLEPGTFSGFNVGTGQGVSVRQIIDTAREVTGHEIPADETERRPGDPPELSADASAIQTALGWRAEWNDIRRTIESAWNWHRSNPRGYGSPEGQ